MKHKLQTLIAESNPKSLSNTIKNNQEVYDWLMMQTKNLDSSLGISERAYLVANQISSNICDISNKPRRFISSTQGYAYCGKATECICAKTSISKKVSDKKTSLSVEEKQAISKKRAETNLKKYGVSNTAQLVSAKEKHKLFYSDREKVNQQVSQQQSTMIIKYGVDNAQKIPEIREKTRNTMMSKYGVDNISKLPEQKLRTGERSKLTWKKRRDESYDYHKLNTKFQTACHTKFTTTPEEYQGVVVSRKYNFVCLNCDRGFQTWIDCGHLPVCKICHPTIHKFKSSEENELFDYLKSTGINVEQRNRSLINPFELDIVCHDKKIAIEYCGLYWHSQASQNKLPDYHINKMNLCNNQGYRLITIFSDEWNNKKHIVKSKLLSIFGKSQDKIGARNCTIKNVTNKQAVDFYTSHHIQGPINSKIHMGLWNQEQLVACMSFGHARAFTNNKVNNTEYELLRYASSIHVQGGASKLLSAFEKEYSPTMIFSYADARWSVGNVYNKLGFVTKSTPQHAGYWYTRDYITRSHRYKFTKSKLVAQGFDPLLTEWQIMQSIGWDRIWDCGQYRFEKHY